MANVLASAHSVLPYNMLLPIVFHHFEIDLDGETDIRIYKPSDAIDHNSISWLGYELERNQWVLKTTHVPIATKDWSDEKTAMDIPPPSPTTTPSSIACVDSLAALFDYASAF